MLDTALSEVTPHYVGADTWPAFADRVLPHLRQMAEGSGGRYLTHDIIEAILAGRLHLFLALRGPEILVVVVTEIIHYPQLRAMRIVGLVGHRSREWMPLLPNLERLAKTLFHCDRMEALHQPGHGRLIASLPGWTVGWHVLSEKQL